MQTKKIVSLLVGALITYSCAASAEDWELSIGANYRNFKGIEFKNFAVNSGAFLDGSITGIDTDNDQIDDLWLYKVASSLQQVDVANLDEITYTQAAVEAGNVDIDSGVGLVLKGCYDLKTAGDFNFKLELSFTTAYTSDRSNPDISVNTLGFNLGEVWNNSPFPGGGPIPDQLEKLSSGFTEMGIVMDGNGLVFARTSLDLSLYTFALGLSGSYSMNDFSVFIAGGPSVSLVDFDLNTEINGIWKDGSDTFYSQRVKEDNSLKCRAGLYAEVGLKYQISEHWAVGVVGRYDYIPTKVNTDLVRIDLSGSSVQGMVSYTF